jgi:hypothetical protein
LNRHLDTRNVHSRRCRATDSRASRPQRGPGDFPGEIEIVPRSWAEKAYPQLIYYSHPEKGGHFAAWEQPQIFSEELRAGFRPLREAKPKQSESK